MRFSFVVVLLLIQAACSSGPRPFSREDPYYGLCCAVAFNRVDVGQELIDAGFDVADCGGSFGGHDIAVRGPQEHRFRAREFVLRSVRDSGWNVTWMADHLVMAETWDVFGFAPGPWCCLAGVQHRRTPTERVLDRLHSEGIPTHFEFGESRDLVFVHVADQARAAALLRRNPLEGVELQPGR